jgi:hypothetical protein
MFIGQNIRWFFPLALLLVFVTLSVSSGPMLTIYAQVVTPVAQLVLEQIQPHQIQVVFTTDYPEVKWQVHYPSLPSTNESVSFPLMSYNLLLYLALLSSAPQLRITGRIWLLICGVPIFFVFHIIDLLLVVESKVLTHTQPDSYVFWQHFDLWFIMVKFCHSFSVMAVKQLFPFLVFFLLWQRFKIFDGQKTAPA